MKDRGGTVLLPLDETEEAFIRVRDEALSFAFFKTRSSGHKFVVREDKLDGAMFFIVPLNETKECIQESGFMELGSILEESLDGPPSSKPTSAIVG
jgi:hypothetical protein